MLQKRKAWGLDIAKYLIGDAGVAECSLGVE